MRTVLKSPRILRTGQPLTLEAIKQVCPAVFATTAHESRGPRYRFIPTIEPLERLLADGWGVFEASQQKANKDITRNAFTKHMLRLRKLKDFDVRHHPLGASIAELCIINAHDATAQYILSAGAYRLVCNNGMMVGEAADMGVRVRHTQTKQTTEEILDGANKIVAESFPRMFSQIELFKALKIPTEQQYRMAERAMKLRYHDTMPPFPVKDLLDVRRPEDEDPTLWNVLNRVQEGAVYGGWKTKSFAFARQSMVRPVERISNVVAINKGLWDEAYAIAKEMSAA